MQCRQSIGDHLFSTLLLEKPLPVQYRFTANLSSSNGKECMTKECKPCKTVCFRPRKYRGPKTPHTKPKEEANFPIPFCTETNQATDDFATQSSEGGRTKARMCICASRLFVCPLRLCVAYPSRSLVSVRVREGGFVWWRSRVFFFIFCFEPRFIDDSFFICFKTDENVSRGRKRTSFCDTRVHNNTIYCGTLQVSK